MYIGVKFCGGCNPRYDRKKYFEQTQLENTSDKFEFAEEGILYDCLLVIGGCTSCCASYKQYNYNSIVKVWDANDIFSAKL